MVWQVLVLGTQTVTVVKAPFTAVNVCGCGPASTVSGSEFTGLMTTVAVPISPVFWVEVAVMVTDVGPVTTGAVKVPLVVMEPALADQERSREGPVGGDGTRACRPGDGGNEGAGPGH